MSDATKRYIARIAFSTVLIVTVNTFMHIEFWDWIATGLTFAVINAFGEIQRQQPRLSSIKRL